VAPKLLEAERAAQEAAKAAVERASVALEAAAAVSRAVRTEPMGLDRGGTAYWNLCCAPVLSGWSLSPTPPTFSTNL